MNKHQVSPVTLHKNTQGGLPALYCISNSLNSPASNGKVSKRKHKDKTKTQPKQMCCEVVNQIPNYFFIFLTCPVPTESHPSTAVSHHFWRFHFSSQEAAQPQLTNQNVGSVHAEEQGSQKTNTHSKSGVICEDDRRWYDRSGAATIFGGSPCDSPGLFFPSCCLQVSKTVCRLLWMQIKNMAWGQFSEVHAPTGWRWQWDHSDEQKLADKPAHLWAKVRWHTHTYKDLVFLLIGMLH